ncbi:MAG: hypothetical protein LBL35_03810 [Clostridiales bacterium]|jgi:hypothetical protein|nr:hypothetical protein [Clostridiales bacterium]
MAPRRISRAKLRAQRFVNALIALRLIMCGIVTVSALYEYRRLDTLLGTGEIAALLGI